MDAGRELDALVATKIMGWKIDARVIENRTYDWYIDSKDSFRLADEIPAYSTDIALAWQVVDHLLDMCGEDGHYRKEVFVLQIAEQGMGDLVRWRAEHAAHIICAAALHAYGVEV